jgi:hypothetical protein
VETLVSIKRFSWPGVIVVAGSTALSWMTGSSAVPPAERASTAARSDREPGNAMPTAASIAAMRLHDWGPRPAAPGRAARDIFAFRRRTPPGPPIASNAPLAIVVPVQPPLALFKLIGVAEDAGAGGVTRTAIISGQGQLYLVKEGETVASIYRVGMLSADSVELLDSTGGPVVRLALK